MSSMASDEVFKSRHNSSSSGSVSSSNSTGSSIHPLVDICNGSSSPSTPRLDRKTAKKGVGRKNSQQEQDVVKHGYLYIKRPPCTNTKIRFKAWQKKFFILRDMSFDNGVSTLEMYENQAAYESVRSAAEYVLDLKNVKNVDSYIESKRFPRAFMVLRSAQAPLVFGTSCDIHKSSWMETINVLAKKRRFVYSCKESTEATCLLGDRERRSSLPWLIHYRTNPLYTRTPPPTKRSDSSVERPPTRTDGPPTPPRNNSVQSNDSGNNLNDLINTKCPGLLVTVQPSSSSSKHKLVGDYYLNVCPGYLALTTVQSLRERLRWPIEHITKFKSEDLKTGENLVTLESSVFSGPSEGSYQFKTMHGSDLIKKVKDAASGVQYGILNTAPTPPPPIAERQREKHLKKTPVTSQTSHSRKHLHLRTDLLREKSTSTPNLMERKKDPQKIVQSGTIQRDVKKTELRYESSSVIATHGYIELLDEEQGDSSFSDVFKKDITRLKYDSDSQVFAALRDSGFSDTDEDEGCSIYVTVPPPVEEGTTSSSSTPSTHSNSGTSSQQQQHSNVVCTQIQTPVDCRPPLPPKSCHRNNNLKDAFMDYYTDVKSLPQAPPVPVIRQTKV